MIPSSSAPRLILASSSSYRRELLARLHLPFATVAPHIDETPLVGEAPESTALRLARAKAEAIARLHPGALVIGSDQVATLDGEQIGKPGDHARALAQLQKMRGREVVFHTALCLWDGRALDPADTAQVENVQVFVRFRDLPDAELDAYLRIEQPYDCAGSAKNEGLGIALIERIDSSDPTALTGLPLIALTSMLRRAGVVFFGI
ncbi:Maf-like protein [Massilia sp. CMS3.1]|uniref:Maf-like protein n=1 Tax=Massilia sp. CMS3.1 TaxID=3373083 RepID=UPI003EE77365